MTFPPATASFLSSSPRLGAAVSHALRLILASKTPNTPLSAPLHELIGESHSERRRSSAKQAESLEVFQRGAWQAMLRDAKSNGEAAGRQRSGKEWGLSSCPRLMRRSVPSVERGAEDQPGDGAVQGHELQAALSCRAHREHKAHGPRRLCGPARSHR